VTDNVPGAQQASEAVGKAAGYMPKVGN
jgi:hypothetical protein